MESMAGMVSDPGPWIVVRATAEAPSGVDAVIVRMEPRTKFGAIPTVSEYVPEGPACALKWLSRMTGKSAETVP